MTEITARAKSILQSNGLRWTKQRQSLIQILSSALDHYVDITEVDHQMRREYPGISHNTIYRNLQEFKKLRLVEINKGATGLRVKLECDDRHHHHFICQRCGKVQEITMPDFEYQQYQEQLPGAKITGHSFELYGYCADCQRQLTHKY